MTITEFIADGEKSVDVIRQQKTLVFSRLTGCDDLIPIEPVTKSMHRLSDVRVVRFTG